MSVANLILSAATAQLAEPKTAITTIENVVRKLIDLTSSLEWRNLIAEILLFQL